MAVATATTLPALGFAIFFPSHSFDEGNWFSVRHFNVSICTLLQWFFSCRLSAALVSAAMKNARLRKSLEHRGYLDQLFWLSCWWGLVALGSCQTENSLLQFVRFYLTAVACTVLEWFRHTHLILITTVPFLIDWWFLPKNWCAASFFLMYAKSWTQTLKCAGSHITWFRLI